MRTPGWRTSGFGGSGVNIYDEEGTEVNYFTIGGPTKLTERIVRRAIASVIAEDREQSDS